MMRRPTVILGPGHSSGPRTLLHPNDHDFELELHHPPELNARLETSETAFGGEQVRSGVSLVRISSNHLKYRIGRMDLEAQAGTHRLQVSLDLLAPAEQARSVAELVNVLVRTRFAQLALPRTFTHLEPGGEGEPDRVENLKLAARLFSEAAQLLATDPPTRVSTTYAEAPPSARFTAAVVQAITHRPYALQPTTPGPRTFSIRGRHYQHGGVHALMPVEDTDTPANRFVHGVGLALERLAHEVRAFLGAEHEALSGEPEPLEGYVHIRQLTRRHLAVAALARLETIDSVIQEVRAARARLESRLPVGAPGLALGAAPRVLLDPRYARVRRSLDLLLAPTQDVYGPEGIVAGVTSLTTLYELYSLSAVHDFLVEAGYELESASHDPTSGPPNAPHVLLTGEVFHNTFRYSHPLHGEVHLLYEPRIGRQPHPVAGLACVAAETTFLTPDVVVVSEDRIAILDAKFTPTPPRDLVADTVLKYLHGLAPASNSRRVVGMHLVHYGASAELIDYHYRPAEPSIGLVPLHPRNRGHFADVIGRYLLGPEVPA